MMRRAFLLMIGILSSLSTFAFDLKSIYTERPNDPEAFYFTPENYGITNDGKMDVSEVLQNAINQVKTEKNFGILFIPEGKYKISKTIYVPGAVRLIGYGAKRPEFILAKNSPGFQEAVPTDKGKANYMFWFTGGIVTPGGRIGDAGAGTFYSAMSNINLRIEDGNPYAVALRTHYAQHSFISHVAVYIGKGKAGLFDIGNAMENVAFYGGDYGIYTTKASPGWQVSMVDAYFEGQRVAALGCQESGLSIINLQVKNVPSVFIIDENYADRLYVENSRFENISGPAIVVSNENNSNNQITLVNVDCKNVPILAYYRRSGNETKIPHKIYKIKEFGQGLQMDDMLAKPEYRTVYDIVPLDKMPSNILKHDVPELPSMDKWVNIRDLGAKGDDENDDTKIFQDAIDKYDVIYVPQGWYKISSTLKMKAETKLIGLHPMGTQLRLATSTPAFSGFGAPTPLLESSEGGNNILSGIGINTGDYNNKAVGVKWMAGEKSFMNDVKYVGGHGTMSKRQPQRAANQGANVANAPRQQAPQQRRGAFDPAWDTQYWSLWVTNNGGGTFQNIWTASTYATSGLYVNNTSTPSRIYAMSLEHHVRNEARFKNVSNWKVYAFQMEEESVESIQCQPLEIENCKNMTFVDLYMFRVIAVKKPYFSSIRLWNNENITFYNLHNYSQIKWTSTIAVYDINKDIEVRPWEFQKLTVTGKEERPIKLTNSVDKVEELARDFEFLEGITSDSKGNIYFSEHRLPRIYKWSVETNSLSIVADFQWKVSALACDSQDNLLVLFRYDAQPNFTEPDFPVLPKIESAGTSFSGWGNSGYFMKMYSINPDNPEETIKELPLVTMGSIKNVHKALYVSNTWRDFHDFNTITVRVPEMCFVAPDGVTIIPQKFDLARTSSLLEAYPGKVFYTSDEYDRRMVKCEVANDGTLSNLQYFVEWGEFGSTVDKAGNVYVADGNIYVFDQNGKEIRMIETPERPMTIKFGGKDQDELFITGRSGLYRIKIPQ